MRDRRFMPVPHLFVSSKIRDGFHVLLLIIAYIGKSC